MYRNIVSILCVAGLALVGTACDSKSKSKDDQKAKAKSAGTKESKDDKKGSAKEKKQAEKKAGDKDAKKIEIQSVGNKFEFKQTELKVKAGQKIHLVFKNTADQKSVKHNFLLLDTNKSEIAKKVAQAGLKAADNEYVPKKGEPKEHVLAHTPLAGPGETVEVTFTAPKKAGKYKYICTFPGHFPKMQGTLIVE